MSSEIKFWSFIDDLKILGDDVKALVLCGGCRWGEPSPIPAIVERLSVLDYRDIENIFPYVICNDVAKTRLRNEVEDIFNYHLYDDLDLDYSDIDRVAIYARWLNRFKLICGKFGMGDIIPLSKHTGDNEPQQYTKELIWLFNGHTDFIDKLRGIGRQEIARKIAKWCMLTHKDGKLICQQRQYLKYARNLVWSGLVPIENDDEPHTINKVRNQLQNANTSKKTEG